MPCPRLTTLPTLTDCPHCGAMPTEECPFSDLSPELVESAPVTAGVAGVCDPDDGVCEACQ